jgi:hypothetical protein
MRILFELFANIKLVHFYVETRVFHFEYRRKLQNLDVILPFNIVPAPQVSWCHCFVMLRICNSSLNGMKAVYANSKHETYVREEERGCVKMSE